MYSIWDLYSEELNLQIKEKSLSWIQAQRRIRHDHQGSQAQGNGLEDGSKLQDLLLVYELEQV